MARDTHRREDLLAEATALVERVSVRIGDAAQPVVIGFRRDGGPSFYFGEEPVYQFNAAGQLRRAFAGGLLLKAERGQLVELRRNETAQAVELVRHTLSESETAAYLFQAQSHLAVLNGALADGHFELAGEVPPGGNVVARARAWLESHAGPLQIARSPRAV